MTLTIPSETRILVTGSHCAGKSTLCSKLLARVPSLVVGRVSVVGELGRAVAEMGYPLGKRATADTYAAFVAGHIRNLLRSDGDVTIFDRGIIDLCAYARANGNLSPASSDMLWELSRWHTFQFDLVLCCEPDFEFVVSDLRDDDESYRTLVDAELKTLLDAVGKPYLLLRGDEASREAAALAAIRIQLKERSSEVKDNESTARWARRDE